MQHIKNTEDIKRLGTIMGIWAHPDDETFLSGGVMAAAVANGQTLVCVTATKGEAGNYDHTRWPNVDLGSIRAAELDEALRHLGIKHHHYLNCQDGCCSDAPRPAIITRLCHLIDKYAPDTILTFGPDGWSGHPDHCQVSRWVSEAVSTHEKKPKVYHTLHTHEQYEKYLKQVDDKLNFFFNIDQPLLANADDCAICFELPKDICKQKLEALKAMESQTDKLFASFSEDFIVGAIGNEYFRLAK
jgi:LmbE family N-acetylglucosaminyl deacetylase